MSVQVRKRLSNGTNWCKGWVNSRTPQSKPHTCLFVAERMKLGAIWKQVSSQTLKFNVKIFAQGKHIKRSGCLDFKCSRISQQLLILGKWEVLGSGRCLWLKIQSCSTGTQWQPCFAGLRLPLPMLQRVGISGVLLLCTLEQGLNRKPQLVPNPA